MKFPQTFVRKCNQLVIVTGMAALGAIEEGHGQEASGGELLLGFSPRNSKDGSGELARWEGWRGPVPKDWQGAPADLIGLSLGGAQNWGSLSEYVVNFIEKECGWAGFERKKDMELSVPMWPEHWRGGEMNWLTALKEEVVNPAAAKNSDLSSYDRLEEGAYKYLDYFHHLAGQLVAKGYQQAIIRLGWEYNGDWFPWGAGKFEPLTIDGEYYDHPRAYREIFRAIRRTMMSVDGAEFQWSWCTAIGAQGYVDENEEPIDYSPWFPGREYVDWVSVDCYDNEVRYYPGGQDELSDALLEKLTWLSYLLSVEGLESRISEILESLGVDLKGEHHWAACRFEPETFEELAKAPWQNLEECRAYLKEHKLLKPNRPGMQWFRDFAAKNEVGFLVSEWGVWQNDPYRKPQKHYSGGDNPFYIQLFAQWIRSVKIPGQKIGALYFEEYNDLSQNTETELFNHSLLKGDHFPRARAAFVKEFAE